MSENANKWREAIISELVCCHLYNETHDKDPRKALKDLIDWHCKAALDPAVSLEARALVEQEKETPWISVAERMPAFAQNVLAWNPVSGYMINAWYGGSNRWEVVRYVSHWMPLPEGPKKEGGK